VGLTHVLSRQCPYGLHAQGVCARRTATKYRNTTTATRHPTGLGATLACSVAKMVVVAGSSGRRGVDHIRAGGRFKDQSTVDRDSYARHLAFDATAARSAAGGA
jgi:hypothetical protein